MLQSLINQSKGGGGKEGREEIRKKELMCSYRDKAESTTQVVKAPLLSRVAIIGIQGRANNKILDADVHARSKNTLFSFHLII